MEKILFGHTVSPFYPGGILSLQFCAFPQNSTNILDKSQLHPVWVGLVWFGLVGLAWLGLAWLGLAWFGLAWFGLVWLGLVWLGLA